MALTARKTVMLEKQYLYVKASKGFQLEGTNIEKIWVNTGYYRFLVDNVAKALSNSYVDILYDPSDIDFIAYCSDLFMEELQNTVVVAVENLQSYVEQFYDRNHEDIQEISVGLSGALKPLVDRIYSLSAYYDEPVTEGGSDFLGISNQNTSEQSFHNIKRWNGSWSSGSVFYASDMEIGRIYTVRLKGTSSYKTTVDANTLYYLGDMSMTVHYNFLQLDVLGGGFNVDKYKVLAIYPDGSIGSFVTSNVGLVVPLGDSSYINIMRVV